MEADNNLQWRVWMKQPETKAFFDELEVMREEIVAAWAAGSLTRESADGTAALQAKALGQVQMLDAILDLRTDKGINDE